MPTHIREGQQATSSGERREVTYDEGIIIFFTDAERCPKIKVPPTRGIPGGVGNFLHRFIGTLACLKGLFCTFVLLGDLA